MLSHTSSWLSVNQSCNGRDNTSMIDEPADRKQGKTTENVQNNKNSTINCFLNPSTCLSFLRNIRSYCSWFVESSKRQLMPIVTTITLCHYFRNTCHYFRCTITCLGHVSIITQGVVTLFIIWSLVGRRLVSAVVVLMRESWGRNLKKYIFIKTLNLNISNKEQS